MGRKLMIGALGALLVTAFAATAMAETRVDFSGSYRVRAILKEMTTTNWVPKAGGGYEMAGTKSSYFDHRLRISMQFMPSEFLTMHVGLNLDGNKWGEQGWSNDFWRAAGGGSSGNDNYPNGSGAYFEVRYYYMSIKTSIGMFSLGRMPGGSAGFIGLGYSGSPLAASDVFDGVTPRDRIKYALASGPMAMTVVYEKKAELDRGTATLAPATRQDDQDWDEFSVTASYRFAGGGVIATLLYQRNHANFVNFESGVPLQAMVPAALAAGATSADAHIWVFNPAVVLNFGPVGIHGEMQYATGSADIRYGGGPTPAGAKDSADISALGYYLDATFNFGPGMVGVQYANFSGDGDTTDYDVDGVTAAGGDFLPFVVAYDEGVAPAALPGGALRAGKPGLRGIFNAANHWMLGFWVDYSVTENLMLHAAYGYFNINEVGEYSYDGGATWKGQDHNFGSEIDFIAKYTIMPNLDFTFEFGYFMPGDYWKSAGTADLAGMYRIKNTLELKF